MLMITNKPDYRRSPAAGRLLPVACRRSSAACRPTLKAEWLDELEERVAQSLTYLTFLKINTYPIRGRRLRQEFI